MNYFIDFACKFNLGQFEIVYHSLCFLM